MWVFSPPFKAEFTEEDNQLMIEQINNARPDVLWVGMTAPKQEKWIHQNKDKLDVPLSGAIGAVFDFYAGSKKRSPVWVCKMGLEWFPRLLREPRRMFRRNFISSPLFLLMVFKISFFCIVNLRNSPLLPAIYALKPNILNRNLLRPYLIRSS